MTRRGKLFYTQLCCRRAMVARHTYKQTSIGMFQHNSVDGHSNMNFILFSYVTKHYSFDFFVQSLKNIKTTPAPRAVQVEVGFGPQDTVF